MLETYFVNFKKLNDHLFGIELFIRFTPSAFRKLPSIYVFNYFPLGFEGRMWDLIVSVPDHCLSCLLLIEATRTVNMHYLLHLLSVYYQKERAGIDFTYGLPAKRSRDSRLLCESNLSCCVCVRLVITSIEEEISGLSADRLLDLMSIRACFLLVC